LEIGREYFSEELTLPARMSRNHFFERVYLEAAAVASMKANEELKSKEMKRSAEKKLLRDLDNVIRELKGPLLKSSNQLSTRFLLYRTPN
jgi:hypothetical protein